MNAPYWTDPDGTLHEMYSAFIVIANQTFGTLSYDSGRADLRWHRCSYAFFCRHCGEIWARIVANNSDGEQQAFCIKEVACERHQDYWNIPGSLLVDHLERLLNDLPPEAVRRELLVHLNHAAKEIENESKVSS